MQTPIVSLIIYGVFLALVISIPLFILFTILRGARASSEAAATQMEIKHLLDEILEIEKETNNLLKTRKVP